MLLIKLSVPKYKKNMEQVAMNLFVLFFMKIKYKVLFFKRSLLHDFSVECTIL